MRILTFVLVLGLAACTTTQTTQVTYVQACGAYSAAFSTAVALRQAGKLSQAEIDTITLVDSKITPICTGPLPVDPTAAAQQVTAAVTQLLILEAAKKVGP